MNRPAHILTAVPSTSLLTVRRLVLAGLTMLSAWLAVKLVLAMIEPSSRWAPVLVAQASPASAQAMRDYDFSHNPFAAGDADAIVIAPEPDQDAPETTLNLQLKGLRSGDNGVAFVRTPDGNQDNYYISDEIMPGVILRGVFPDYVLIDVNGQTQRLTTDDAKAARSTQNTQSRPSGLQTMQSADAARLLSQIQIIPAFDQDMNRTGLSVKPRSSAVDLSVYGLRNGDIITRFAGQSTVSGMPDIAAMRRTVSSGRPVIVDIIRDGQPMSITIGSAT